MSYCLYCGQKAENVQPDSPFCSHSCAHKHEVEQRLTSSMEEQDPNLVEMLYQITQSDYLADCFVAMTWHANKLLAENRDLPPAVAEFLGIIARGNDIAANVYRFVKGCDPYVFTEEKTAVGT